MYQIPHFGPVLALITPTRHRAYQDVGSLGLSKHAEGTDHLFILFINPMHALGALERPREPTSW